MRWFQSIRKSRKNSAKVAKDRLKIVISHERARRNGPSYLPKLEQEVLKVIRKYVQIGEDQVRVQLEKEEDREILELNITLPTS